jgi:hypothetical protein
VGSTPTQPPPRRERDGAAAPYARFGSPDRIPARLGGYDLVRVLFELASNLVAEGLTAGSASSRRPEREWFRRGSEGLELAGVVRGKEAAVGLFTINFELGDKTLETLTRVSNSSVIHFELGP